MSSAARSVDLGLIHKQFEAPVHICQVYKDDAERLDSLVGFVSSGLREGERVACIIDKVTVEELGEELARIGVSLGDATASGAVTISSAADAYFEGGRFDPERMLDVLCDYHEHSVEDGCPGARVIGEMTPDVQHVTGGDRLMEYEARVTLLMESHPVTAICQYDAREFDGSTIMDVLRVHPLLLVSGGVVRNPYYVSPEEILAP